MRWDISGDGLRYRFYLVKDAWFSNGEKITAEDYAESLRRGIDRSSNERSTSPIYGIAGEMEYKKTGRKDALGIHAVGDLELEIVLSDPAPFFFMLLAIDSATAQPHNLLWDDRMWEEKITEMPFSGPFRVASYDPSSEIVLTRNPYYRGDFSGNVATVRYKILSQEECIEQYRADRVDITYARLSGVDDLYQSYGDHYQFIPVPGAIYLMLNPEKPPFDDVLFRQAVVHALDRKAIARGAIGNLVEPAAGGVLGPAFPGHTPNIGLRYDPVLAKLRLRDAGYDSACLPTAILTVHEGAMPELIEYIRRAWRDILGLEIDTRSVSMEELWDIHKSHDYEMMIAGIMYRVPNPKRVFTNLVPIADRIRPLQQAGSWEEGVAAAREADEYATKQAIAVPIAYTREHAFVKPWIKNYDVFPSYACNITKAVVEDH